MKTKTGELVRLIQPVTSVPAARRGTDGILASLNWPARICDTISDILDYGKAVKTLEVEAKRIEEEAAIQHHQIDATLRLALEERGLRNHRMQKLLAQAAADLKRSRISQRETAAMILCLSNVIASSASSAEHRKAAQETLAELIKLQTGYMQDARETFDRAASATQTETNPVSFVQHIRAVMED